MRTEQQALKVSLVGVLIVSALGIGFGVVSGSFAILFDGVFSLVDAVMSVVSITLAGLIAKSASNALSKRTHDRFTMGFWHFEPIVLAVNALLMMSVAAYALFQAISALLTGGRDVEFGPAVVYAAVVVVLTLVIGFIEHRANKKLGSALVAMDVKGWIMAGGVTGALLAAFLIGMLIEDTDAEWAMPYVDPAVLAIVALILLPMPFSTLRRALAEISLVTPPELKRQAEGAAQDVTESEGFTDYRVYAAQQGRARTIDVVFYVPTGMGLRSLEDWDRIRDETRAQLDGEDPHSWITVSFTTKTPPPQPQP
ncbi:MULTISPECIES: cation diffusion facilitator family transporter [unclassified Nesterenkonia]|uniref:cation diffusion facilitator family transporter n=1 Tax=unclassified Nesterenkonia TaxID=2629769 RepID=UPI001F4CD03E|nr:cation transporter [Nesterenkonia sp. DZ6]MCH8561827.1 cation transporter [Nesterenkonia sp. YGD6]MCH8570265.1 cation transporter [Nesterenkonia sp. AY15]